MSRVADRSHPKCRHCPHLRAGHRSDKWSESGGACVSFAYEDAHRSDGKLYQRIVHCPCPGFESIDTADDAPTEEA